MYQHGRVEIARGKHPGDMPQMHPDLIAALVVPSLIWCLSDRSLWAWDQSLYGYWSLATWTARSIVLGLASRSSPKASLLACCTRQVPFPFRLVAIAVLIASAVVVSTTRDGRQGSLSRRVETLWKRGTLFALTLAGAVILTIVAYSLQINEDQRFLIITTPMIAVLAGWSLHMLRSKLLSIGFALMLTLNAAATHLFAAGIDPVHLIPFGYLTASEVHESKSMALLKATIGPTCPLDGDNRARIVAVNYRNLNVNSTMFYSSQLNFDSARRCAYQWLPFPSKSFKDILDFISFVDPPFIVTVEPSRQPPPDFVNDLSKQVAEWLATNPRYERILMLDNGFSVYRQRASDLDD